MKQHKLDQTLPHSIVFYDHACGICRIEMSKLKKYDPLQRLLLVDISSPHFKPRLWGINYHDAIEQLHVRTPAGDWLVGIPAIRHIYAEVGLGWIWWPTKLPIIGYVSQHFYRWFARHRIGISKNLGIYSHLASTCKSCPANKGASS